MIQQEEAVACSLMENNLSVPLCISVVNLKTTNGRLDSSRRPFGFLSSLFISSVIIVVLHERSL